MYMYVFVCTSIDVYMHVFVADMHVFVCMCVRM